MLNTFTSYSLIARDIDKSISRVQKEPTVSRDTAYYLNNIGKVKTVDEFVDNDRLFRYAMKAYGLEDMAYAKAFMKKVLKEGVTDPNSFANKLTDKRYAEFAKAFNFAKYGDNATTYNASQVEVTQNFVLQTIMNSGQSGYAYVEEETSNYLDNIASVKSIDDLMGDPRLLKYAMAAYGLDSTQESAARVREMLEGGVSDPNSPANKLAAHLGDERYANFVSAFNFVEYGEQTTAREAVRTDTPKAYVQEAGLSVLSPMAQAAPSADDAYFQANIGQVKTIGNLIGDSRLLTYAMAAFGLDARTEPPEKVRAMLEGGVSDPNSPANQLADKRYANFVSAFNFAEYGTTTTSSADLVDTTLKLHAESTDPENAYFRANIGSATSINALLGNQRLFDYALSAYGLDPSKETPERIRAMLEGGVSDPNSPANQLADKRYANFVAAFNFADYGPDATSRPEMVERTVTYHKENANPETAYFRANIAKVQSIGDLMADKRLLTYAMAAYGLDASNESATTVRSMLEGGVSDPNSPANKLADKSYARFVAAFDFATYGQDTTTRPEVLDATSARYTKMTDLGLVKLPEAYVKDETAYYKANVGKLTSIDDLMADKRLLNYALYAYGIDPTKQTPEGIRAMLEGGVSDPDSPANKLTDKSWAGFVTAFNFAEYGETATTRVSAGQPTVDKYMRQTLEEEAGDQNEGVRLALYFQRKASDITNYYEVLADTALATVMRTALGLPDSFSSADIDKQVKLFESKLPVEDLQDPKKLEKFMQRFTTMYELNNPSSGSGTPSVSVLFAQPTEYGVSTSTLLAIQSMRR